MFNATEAPEDWMAGLENADDTAAVSRAIDARVRRIVAENNERLASALDSLTLPTADRPRPSPMWGTLAGVVRAGGKAGDK